MGSRWPQRDATSTHAGSSERRSRTRYRNSVLLPAPGSPTITCRVVVPIQESAEVRSSAPTCPPGFRSDSTLALDQSSDHRLACRDSSLRTASRYKRGSEVMSLDRLDSSEPWAATVDMARSGVTNRSVREAAPLKPPEASMTPGSATRNETE